MTSIKSKPTSIRIKTQNTNLPAWAKSLPLWQWYQIPNTKLSSVDPNPPVPGHPASKITSWNGAALKTEGSIYLIGAAGGHGDYSGNEVNALQLNTDTPKWVQLRAPSTPDNFINIAQFYLDKRQAPTHTYWSIQFINSHNRLVILPSQGMNWAALPSAPLNWPYYKDKFIGSFSLDKNDWDDPEHFATWPGEPSENFIACFCVKHPVTENIYYSRLYKWWMWSPVTNTWKVLSEKGRGTWYAGSAIDPKRNLILLVGSYQGDMQPEVRNLSGEVQAVTFKGLGASALKLTGYPGVVYDEANDNYLVFKNGTPIEVLRVNPDTWTIDSLTMTGTRPGFRDNGIHNAVQYAPELRGVVLAVAPKSDVFLMRTSE